MSCEILPLQVMDMVVFIIVIKKLIHLSTNLSLRISPLVPRRSAANLLRKTVQNAACQAVGGRLFTWLVRKVQLSVLYSPYEDHLSTKAGILYCQDPGNCFWVWAHDEEIRIMNQCVL